MSFAEDWSRILRLEKEKMRTLSPIDVYNWSLRVYLYSDGSGIGCDVYWKDTYYDDYTPRVDRFFPIFKRELKEYLAEIHGLLAEGKEEEAEDQLVALPKFLKGLQDGYSY